MSDKLQEKIDKLAEEVAKRKGQIKADSNEMALHPKVVARLGEYVEVAPLKSGDYAFNTAWGKVARIEYKKWDDLIASIGSKRLNDQLRRQLEDNDLSILLCEGMITSTASGKIKTIKKEYPQPWWWLWNYLTSVQMAGTYIYFSPNEYLTPRIIIALFEYCQKEEHNVMTKRQRLITMHPSLTPHQRSFTAITGSGVGDETAKILDDKYHSSIAELCQASIAELMSIPGISKLRATKIWNYIHGKE